MSSLGCFQCPLQFMAPSFRQCFQTHLTAFPITAIAIAKSYKINQCKHDMLRLICFISHYLRNSRGFIYLFIYLFNIYTGKKPFTEIVRKITVVIYSKFCVFHFYLVASQMLVLKKRIHLNWNKYLSRCWSYHRFLHQILRYFNFV